jgi:hypothetical protein
MWLHHRVFYSRSFEECCDLIFMGLNEQQECREGCFLFEHSWTVWPFEDENTMVSRNVENQIPRDAASYPRTMDTKQRGNAEYHTITMPRCATRLFRLFSVACEVSFWVFAELHHRVSISSTRIVSLCLLIQFHMLNSVWQNFFEISVQIHAWHQQFKSDCWWLRANKSYGLVITTATVRNAV